MTTEPISDAEQAAQEADTLPFGAFSTPAAIDGWMQMLRDDKAKVARIRALEAEVTRKDAALRPFARRAGMKCDYVGVRVDDCRAARAALGPAQWVPTHMIAEKIPVAFIREAIGAADDTPAVLLYRNAEGIEYARYKDDKNVRALTPDEARAATEGRS